MKNTKAFRTALGETLSELARRGVTVRPGTVADTIEANMTAVARQLGIQPRSAWRYFDAAALADTIAKQVHEREDRGSKDVGCAPMPPVGNPELALILAGVPDALAESGGDLYAVMVNVAVNAWMAGHIHGEDGCDGCEGARGPAGHDWQARMDAVSTLMPDIDKWFDRDVWTAALHDSGYGVTRR
ncbi:hypothetical protein OG948_59865 (plasmid) [Embleya sp. NBC_00888]|uniref:hypothetical protein n=1 Tax=Embleya sp. NBC_00888 TaxID=2975960 RepID=UPI002F90D1BE|nr:hypothetical protein OG948_59865 [Embleya sp. NBC_00888]